MDTVPINPDRTGQPSALGGGAAAPAQGKSTGAGLRAGAGAAFNRQLTDLRQGVPLRSPDIAPDRATGMGVVEVTARKGDTLTSLVRDQWVAQGGTRETLSANDAHRWALQVARRNALSNPDIIAAGQVLVVGPPPKTKGGNSTRPDATFAASAPSSSSGAVRTSAAIVTPNRPIVRVDAPSDSHGLGNPLLQQTLDRAVGLGYIPQHDRQSVGERIETLATKHGFLPDDFAKTVLMESDGLNPRATNGNCHGIIQFCSGPDRGAASAGYGQRPREILNLSVLQQLDLVDRYFDDTRLKDFRGRDGRVRLDDLYLTILTPAARQERQANAPLPIAGPQALDLYVRREREGSITRSSIVAGLNVNARSRLGQFMVADLMAR